MKSQEFLEAASIFQADQTAVLKTKGKPFKSNDGAKSSGK